MLNGTTPIMLFNFFKLTPDQEASLSSIPIVSDIVSKVGLPPIPLYLDEQLTGLVISSQNKNIDIETSIDTLKNGDTPVVNQKAIGSVTTINLVAQRDSVGVQIISALADLILEKVTSKEYSITYLNGAVTIFNGLLHGYSINEGENDDLYQVQIQISRGGKGATVSPPKVDKIPGAVTLGGIMVPRQGMLP